MSQFARNWLDIWCFLVVLFGAVLAGADWPQTDEPAHRLLSFLNPTVNDTLNDTERFAVGLMGAVTIGWGLTLFYLIRAAHKYGPPLWRHITIVAVVWYAIDGAISIATGFGLNVYSNTILIAGLLIPIYTARKI